MHVFTTDTCHSAGTVYTLHKPTDTDVEALEQDMVWHKLHRIYSKIDKLLVMTGSDTLPWQRDANTCLVRLLLPGPGAPGSVGCVTESPGCSPLPSPAPLPTGMCHTAAALQQHASFAFHPKSAGYQLCGLQVGVCVTVLINESICGMGTSSSLCHHQ